jgi:TetR/AcrR family transcriptional regulator, transcriptional repressor for nem operon
MIARSSKRVVSARDRAKAESHERILESASKLVKRTGLGAASVPRVMRGAGLTVGGFYAHFRSKRAMDAKVIARAMREVWEQWFDGLEDSEGIDWLARAIKRYLSPSHRDNLDGGCVLPSTISELTRADRVTRAAAADAFEEVIAAISEHAPEARDTSARERALATVALTVGALTLSRALRGHPLSDELLAAARKWALPEPSARPPRRN